MNVSARIGCPLRQAAVATLALKFSLLLLASLIFSQGLHAQCDGIKRGLDEFHVHFSTHFADQTQKVVVLDLKVAGMSNACQLFYELESESALPKIDSIQLDWVTPYSDALPNSLLNWSQEGNGKLLNLDFLLDGCRPVYESTFEFRLKVFVSYPLTDEWRISAIDGGIVQVDVIQARMGALETQRIYRLDGILVREIERPIRSLPATEGLNPGMYLLRRMHENQVISCEKVWVW